MNAEQTEKPQMELTEERRVIPTDERGEEIALSTLKVGERFWLSKLPTHGALRVTISRATDQGWIVGCVNAAETWSFILIRPDAAWFVADAWETVPADKVEAEVEKARRSGGKRSGALATVLGMALGMGVDVPGLMDKHFGKPRAPKREDEESAARLRAAEEKRQRRAAKHAPKG